jgi:hypothetical protein
MSAGNASALPSIKVRACEACCAAFRAAAIIAGSGSTPKMRPT